MPVATSGTRAYSRPLMISRSASANEPMVDALREPGPVRDAALAELHALLLRGAHHELRRRPELLARLSRGEVDDLAHQATDDAMTAILAKLDTFRGESRFTTWAYKFVLLEAGVKARRRAWQGREVMLEDESWRRLADTAPSAQQSAEECELLAKIAKLPSNQDALLTAAEMWRKMADDAKAGDGAAPTLDRRSVQPAVALTGNAH